MNDAVAQLDNARVLVVGCGATGVSAARFAVAHGAVVHVIDSRAAPPGVAALRQTCPAATLHTGALDTAAVDDMDALIVSPGVDLREPLLVRARERGLPITGDIEWFARCVDAPVVAITGSNGKSTVTAWLAEVARAAGMHVAVGGNFGTPALDLLDTNAALYILELSSFQLALTDHLPCVAATVLNLSPDHIDRHGDMQQYAAAKARIFEAADTAVVNADDPAVVDMPVGRSRVVLFGHDANCDYRLIEDESGERQLCHDGACLACRDLPLQGRHNHYNALAVWALAQASGFTEVDIFVGLQRFAGLPHRCQWVASVNGVDWVNDSKGTNLGAMLASLSGMDMPVVLLAGGQAKGADFSPLADVAARKTRAVIVFGEDAAMIAAALADRATVYRVDDLNAAVARAAELAVAGDTVLLSPGCASLDQFRDYAERGDVFMTAVRRLAA